MTDGPPAALPVHARLCRNCGTPAPGDYCPTCGQETRARLPTLREFMREAAGRYVAFDGRMWRTLAALVLHPGLLTREYLAGRRRRYIRPARLFLVTALILFSLIRLTVGLRWGQDAVIVDAAPAAKGKASGEEPLHLGSKESFAISIDKDSNLIVKGAQGMVAVELDKPLAHFNRLPAQDKREQMVAGMLRYGPYAMFALLPAFTWVQMVTYLGRAGRYRERPRLYAEHLVYGAHLHTFLFLVLALAVVLPWWPVHLLLAGWSVYYVLRAKHAVYGGSWRGGLLRSIVVGVVYVALMALALVGLLLAAILLR